MEFEDGREVEVIDLCEVLLRRSADERFLIEQQLRNISDTSDPRVNELLRRYQSSVEVVRWISRASA